MDTLLQNIRACTFCKPHLPFDPRPVVQAGVGARILIIGQAPGEKVNRSGIPWSDASGRELRRWLGVDELSFYDASVFALVPMGFCYPGRGTSGDLPPRPECARLWHGELLSMLTNVRLTLLIGQYAHKYYLGNRSKRTLTENVQHFESFLPEFLPLVHPSPRNRIWQKKNPWFETDLLPDLRSRIAALLQ